MAGYDDLLTDLTITTTEEEGTAKLPVKKLRLPELSVSQPTTKRVELKDLPQERTGGYDDYIEAAAAGVLNALPFGEKLTKDNRAARELPLAETAGEVIGSIPAFGLIKKLPFIAKAEKVIEKAPLATKVLGKTLSGAGEMALYQTAKELPQDKPLAEKVQAVKQAAGMGGAFGLAGEAVPIAKQFVSDIKGAPLGITPPGGMPPEPGPIKKRSVTETIKESPYTDPKLLEKLETELYTQRNTAAGMARAKLMVDNYPLHAKAIFNKPGLDDNKAFIGQALIKKAQEQGNYDEAVKIVKDLAARGTESGRFSQALSAYNRLTPEGILRYAQGIIDDANKLDPKLNLSMTPDKAQDIVTQATRIAGMADGKEKEMATREMLKGLAEIVPPTLTRKISTIQTMAQLFNPKTIIRNVVGNTMFTGLENVAQTVATPIDKVLSLATGKRTTGLPSPKTQVKGFGAGWKEGVEAAKKGINLDQGTQFDLPTVATFRDGIMGNLEKAMNISLRAPDRAAYRAAFDDSIRSQMSIARAATATPEMIEQAHLTGLYRTFQDTNAATQFFSGMKKVLNTAGVGQGGDRFGLGDLILKYPKTPANLLARAYDYSPLGFITAIKEAVPPLMGKEFNQKAFVDGFSRSLTGTAGIGLAALLAKTGIISGQLDRGKRKLKAFNRMQGVSDYQVNASALKRLLLSGFNPEAAKLRPGDTLVTYDWAQPVSVNMAMGAKLANSKNLKEGALSLLDILESGTTTLAEQPLLTGVKQFFGGTQSMPQAIAQTLVGGPASFVPTLFNQVATMVDSGSKNVASNEMLGFREAFNKAMTKIPGIKSILPKAYDVFGKETVSYQGTPTIPNVFLNPAFVTKYQPNAEAQELARLMASTGETKQLPVAPSRKILINGNPIALSGKELSRYQKLAGAVSYAYLTKIVNSPEYQQQNDDEKVKTISNIMSQINKAAKIRLVAERFYNETKTLPREAKINYLKKQQDKGVLNKDIYDVYLELLSK